MCVSVKEHIVFHVIAQAIGKGTSKKHLFLIFKTFVFRVYIFVAQEKETEIEKEKKLFREYFLP